MQRRRFRLDEAGFGLAELLVAMTIMAIVLMALAPFLVSAFRTTARNVRIAGATELVNQRVDLAQSSGVTASCDAFNKFLGKYDDPTDPANRVTDSNRSITYIVKHGYDFKLSGCSNLPAPTDKATYYYVVEVVDEKNPTVVLAKAATWVAVPGFGS